MENATEHFSILYTFLVNMIFVNGKEMHLSLTAVLLI